MPRIGHGFGVDDGASLLMAFRGLQAESAVQGEVHLSIAQDLENLLLDPFVDWSAKHRDRIYDSRTVLLDEWVKAYESGQSDVSTHNVFCIKIIRVKLALGPAPPQSLSY